MEKAVVHYIPEMSMMGWVKPGESAHLQAVDHPFLGSEFVTTSVVQTYDSLTGVIETMNTIYTPAEK